MKLKSKELQWIYDNIDRFKQAVVALDFARAWNVPTDDVIRNRADEQVHDLAFSFLMVAMGENIPKTLWSVDDYSMLYGNIMDAKENGDIEVTDNE